MHVLLCGSRALRSGICPVSEEAYHQYGYYADNPKYFSHDFSLPLYKRVELIPAYQIKLCINQFSDLLFGWVENEQVAWLKITFQQLAVPVRGRPERDLDWL